MNVQPTKLVMPDGRTLVIEFSNGSRRQYSTIELREACPCANCKADPPDVIPGITIHRMNPVGNYAYKIQFSDGHDAGIYPIELLLKLGKETTDE